jgi:2-keto-3-deoxy-galactonokinase
MQLWFFNKNNDARMLFCGDESGDLHEASTFMIDRRVRECALELQDTVLLAKLSAGDLISQEAKYHTTCLINLYNRTRKHVPKTEEERQESVVHGLVLAELVDYIDASRSENDAVPVFKLIDLQKLYTERLEQLGVFVEGRVIATRLKNRILAALPDLQAHKQGRDVLLVF